MTGRLYTRIVLNFLVLIGIGMIAVTLWFYLTVGRTVARDVHAMLRSQTGFIVSLVESRLDDSPPAAACETLLTRISDEMGVETALLKQNGNPLIVSDGLADRSLVPVSTWKPAVKKKGRFVQSGHSGGPVIYVLPVDNPGEAPVYLYTSRKLSGNRHQLAFLGGLLAIGFLLAAAVHPLSRSITRPLSQLTGSLEKIAAGDFAVAPVSRRRDEIGRLFAVFREMSRSVDAMIRSSRQLLADISHELRSPLTRIRMSTELLRGAVVGDKPERYLNGIESEITVLDRLVARMAEFSRMNLPGFVLSAAPVSPADLAARMHEQYLPMADTRQINLSLAVDQNLPDIYGDVDLLARVFGNLLDNAFGNTPAGGRITIGVRDAGRQVCFFVTDTGPGIPAKHRERIFEPLYRVDPARNSETGGAGLGLAIAHKIIDLHQGRIEYRRNNGETGFDFYLDNPPPSSRR